MRFFHRKPGRLHPDDMQLILRSIDKMTAATDRLNASVTRIIGDVATEIRNHPAAQNDDGQLNGLANWLDAASADLETENPAPATPPATPPAGQ